MIIKLFFNVSVLVLNSFKLSLYNFLLIIIHFRLNYNFDSPVISNTILILLFLDKTFNLPSI